MKIATRTLGIWGVLACLALGIGAGAQSASDFSADALQANLPPEAVVSGHQLGVIGERIELDASASVDADSERLKYLWTLETPPGSGARLSDPSSPRPFFVVDLVGDYTASVVVSDGRADSEPATVRVSTHNRLPFVRAALTERTFDVGQSVTLDARDVLAVGNDPVRWQWRVEQRPDVSRAALAGDASPLLSFAPDAPGTYVLAVEASTANGESATARFLLDSGAPAPRTVLPDDLTLHIGSTATLMPERLENVRGDAAYQWQLRHAPRGSETTIEHAQRDRASVLLDAPGLYVAQLVVTSGDRRSQPQTLVIEAVAPFDGQHRPIASPLVGGLSPERGGSDIDGDGVPDDIDNCVETPNPNQIDTNNDGFGNFCDPDLDNDGLITNTVDLGLLRVAFFSRPGDPNWNPDADFNSDGVVNIVELGILRNFFFNAPGPIANEFINPAGGSWHDPTNWSLGFIPNAAHAVRIDLAPGVEVEFSTGDTQISSIRTTSPLVFSGGTLNITRQAEFNDTVAMSGTATLENAPMLPPTQNAAAQITVGEFANVTFDNVVLANDMTVLRGSTVRVLDGLLLDNVTVSLDGDSNTSRLRFEGSTSGTSTFGGIGEVRFAGTTPSNNVREILIGSSGHSLIVGPNITVGSGTVGGRIRHVSSNGGVTMQGRLEANVSGASVSLDGAPLVVEGAVDVSSDSRALLTFRSSGGLFAASAVGTADTGELELNGEFLIEGGITVTDGVLDLGTTDGAVWDNDGTIALVNSTVELGGGFDAAAIGNLTGTATSIIDGVFDNMGQTTELSALLPGALELATPGRVVGGTLEGATLTLADFENFTLDGVTLAANIDVLRGANLDIENSLTLAGATVSLGGDSNTSRLRFEGDALGVSTLDGTGEVRFIGTTTSSNVREILVSSSQHGLIIGSGITVRSDTTGGRIRQQFSNGPITFQGLLEAGLASRTVSLQGAPLRVEGDVSVFSDGRAVLDFAGTGGVFAASATAVVNTGELEFNGEFVIEGSITVTDGVLDLGTTNASVWDNNGSIVLNNATLELGGGFTAGAIGNVTGTGTTVIDGTLDNTGQVIDLSALAPGTLELATPGRVVGGTIQGSTLTLREFQNFTLEGVTLASDVNVERGANLDAEGGLTLAGAVITLGGDSNTSRLRFEGPANDVSTFGGTGEVRFAGTTSSSNVREILVASSLHGLTVAPGIAVSSVTTGGRVRHVTSNGPITFEGQLNANVASRVVTLQAAPLTVAGDVNVSNDSEALLTFQGGGGVFGATATGTVNTGELAFSGEFVIDGAINATDGIVDLGSGDGAAWDNNGAIALTNSTVQLGGSFDAAALGSLTGTGTSAIDGTFDNVGQTTDLSALLPGALELATPGRVVGGTLSGSTLALQEFQNFTLDGVTLSADVSVLRGANLDVENGLTLAGATINLDGDSNTSRLRIEGPAAAVSTIGGTGEIRFVGTTSSSNVREVLVASSLHGLIVGPNVTVGTDTTGGRIRHVTSNGPITIQGTVVADVASRVVSLSASPLTISGDVNVVNDSTVLATFQNAGGVFTAGAVATVNTGEFALVGDVIIDGTINATDSVLDFGDGTAGTWVNNGSVTLGNSVLELGGAFDAASIGSLIGTGTTVIDGVFDNTGQTFDAGAALVGAIELGTPGRLVGGTLTGSATPAVQEFEVFILDGVTLAADIIAQRGGSIDVENGLTLASGNVILDGDSNTSRLRFRGAAAAVSTFGGTGEVRFAGTTSSSNVRELTVGSSQHGLIIGSGITVRSLTTGGRIRHVSSNGPITIDGSVVSDVAARSVILSAATISPLQINGSLTVAAGASMDLDDFVLGGSASVNLDVGGTATSAFGRLVSNDDATLDGTLNVSLVNGFVPTPGDTFAIATYASAAGTFATENTAGLSIAYNAGDITLTAP